MSSVIQANEANDSSLDRSGWPFAAYFKLVVMLTIAAAVLLALGFLPSRRLGGQVAIEAMLVGTAISWFACALAGIPLVGIGSGMTSHIRMLLSTGVRLLIVVAFTLTLLLGGVFPALPLMIWVATSYFFLMFVDTGFAFWRLKNADDSAVQASAVAEPRRP